MKHEEMEKLIFQLRKETWYEFNEYCQKAMIESYSKWLNQRWEDSCEEYEIDYSVYSVYDLTETESYNDDVVEIKNYILNSSNYTTCMKIKDLNSRIEDLEEFLEENGEDEIQSFIDNYKEDFFEELAEKYYRCNSEPDYWDGWEVCFEAAVKEATGMTFQEFISKNTNCENEE